MVYVFLADGFEEIEAVTTVDIIRRANIEVQTVSIQNTRTVTGSHGIIVTADLMAAEINKQNIEAVILPGGMPGTTNLQNSKAVEETLRYAAEHDKWIAAICAAPSVLGYYGYLKGKNAVCFPGFEDQLTGANVQKVPVVTDGKIITSRGAGTAHLFAFTLVALLKNSEIADKIKKGMLYE